MHWGPPVCLSKAWASFESPLRAGSINPSAGSPRQHCPAPVSGIGCSQQTTWVQMRRDATLTWGWLRVTHHHQPTGHRRSLTCNLVKECWRRPRYTHSPREGGGSVGTSCSRDLHSSVMGKGLTSPYTILGGLHLRFLHTKDAALLLVSIRIAAVASKAWRQL